MAFDRIALVGDAAFIPRPHTASGVSQGAVNAIAIADALSAQDHNLFEKRYKISTGCQGTNGK